MRLALPIALIAHASLVRPVLAGELVAPTIDYHDMRVLVSYVPKTELARLERESGARVYRRDLRPDRFHGLSILKRNRETGALTCEIYLPVDQRPRQVDDERTLTLGHELLHCMLGDYHR